MGPMTREKLLDAMSTPKADETRSAGTVSAIMARRTGKSVAHTTPEKSAPSGDVPEFDAVGEDEESEGEVYGGEVRCWPRRGWRAD